MAWTMSGTYVANCSCQLICPCPVDNPPTGPDGQCRGVAVFDIARGELDEVDLSGVTFAFCNLFPSNLSAGNWKVGVVIDEAASDEQAAAIERIPLYSRRFHCACAVNLVARDLSPDQTRPFGAPSAISLANSKSAVSP